MVALSLGATSPKGEQMIPKGYKHTELGVLPEDWQVVRLGDVCDVRDGTHESPKPKDEGKILITSKNLKNGRIDFSDSYYISLEDFESINKRSKVEKYDVLMSMIGTVGEVALIDCVPDFAIKNVALFKTNGDIKLSRYLFYFFQSPSGKKCISSFLSGSTQKYITLDFLRNLQISLPPLAEQEKIAEILSAWDTQIQNFETLITEKQALKKGLCQTLLTAKTRLRGFSGDWEVVRLGDIAEIKRGASPRPIQDPKWFDEDSKIHWIRISDINNKYLCGTEQKLSKIGVEKSRYVPINSLIMSMCATLGRPAITKIETCIHDGFVCFYNLRASEEFLFYYLKLIEERWKFKGQLGSQSNLNTDIIKNLQIPLPPLAEQEKIAEILSEADNEITLLEQKLESLKSQKKGLMQKLLNGKVRVKS